MDQEEARNEEGSEAEQDFGSDYGEEEEADSHQMVALRNSEWSPKQYSVSSNEEQDHNEGEEGMITSPDPNNYNSDDYGDQDNNEDPYAEHNNVFRDIVNERRHNVYLSGSGSDEEPLPQ